MTNWNPNINHPRKGDHISVEPIREIADIKAIKEMLSGQPRNLLLFTMGINGGLRTGDLLKLKVKDVRDKREGDEINIIEGKTGKPNFLTLNKSILKALRSYLEKMNPKDEDYLFASKKGEGALTISAVNLLMKKWAKAIHLKGNFGAHTLRKTFGFQQRTKFGVGIELLMERFNHSSPSVTRRYLGINNEEVGRILLNEI